MCIFWDASNSQKHKSCCQRANHVRIIFHQCAFLKLVSIFNQIQTVKHISKHTIRGISEHKCLAHWAALTGTSRALLS